MTQNRAISARQVREDAARLSHDRAHPDHHANGDEQRYAGAHYAMSFSKGLDHDHATGLVADPAHFEAFRHAIDAGRIDGFTTSVQVPDADPRRKWEAPTAGLVYDLQGPDAQAVTMAPAPALGSHELAFEMAEVYELALLRDVPFPSFDQNGGNGSAKINAAVDRLNALPYATQGFRGRPRKTDATGKLTRQTIFRGSSPGVEVGPYLSQFLLIGTKDQTGLNTVADGKISYGALQIDQRVASPAAGDDYMMKWDDWYHVQQGYVTPPGQNFAAQTRRFIHTPRDLATFVHFDALYEAYLNACLILLDMGTPFDTGFANLAGSRPLFAGGTTWEPNATGFALFGGPHILTLVTEVATRALKAVRYQKFNNHLRLRPEALAARIEKADEIDTAHPVTCGAFAALRDEIWHTVDAIKAFNLDAPIGGEDRALLPMAFSEGSPMHPSYGAGHAAVAGACVTVLKAFFDTGTVFGETGTTTGFFHAKDIINPVAFTTRMNGTKIEAGASDCPLTLEGELNKLAANIAVGRNMAGVHYFADYFDSLRMGEKIAIGVLEEQALCYPTDSFVLSLPTFDGPVVRIGRL